MRGIAGAGVAGAIFGAVVGGLILILIGGLVASPLGFVIGGGVGMFIALFVSLPIWTAGLLINASLGFAIPPKIARCVAGSITGYVACMPLVDIARLPGSSFEMRLVLAGVVIAMTLGALCVFGVSGSADFFPPLTPAPGSLPPTMSNAWHFNLVQILAVTFWVAVFMLAIRLLDVPPLVMVGLLICGSISLPLTYAIIRFYPGKP